MKDISDRSADSSAKQKYRKEYYRIHTDHYAGQNLGSIPSFAWLKSRLPRKKKGVMLDAGCGTGYLLDWLTPPGWKGVGVDISREAIGIAAENYPELGFSTGSLTKLPFPSSVFDAVVCFNVIEHIGDQDKAMMELVRVLRPGGTLLIGTNIRNSLSWTLFRLFLGGDPTHVREFSSSELVRFVKRYLAVSEWTESSCIARFRPAVNAVFHLFLKGDILVRAIKK